MYHHHIREIIKVFSFDQLVNTSVIPDLKKSIDKKAFTIKKYPPFVYKNKCFDYFGLFMEKVLARYLDTGSIQELVSECDKNGPFEQGTLIDYIPTLIVMCKSLSDKLKGPFYFNVEITFDQITAHPDIITDDCVFEVKNTMNFEKMFKESMLQVLCYYTLLKLTRPQITNIGFVLPMQRCVFKLNLDSWDTSIFLQLLLSQIPNISYYNQPLLRMPLTLNFEELVGNHVEKGKDLVKTFEQFNRKVCQMFLTNPRGSKSRKFADAELQKAEKVLRKKGIMYYTHAPYTLNLCNVIDIDDNWRYDILCNDLLNTQALNGCGVVVHVGQYKENKYSDAVEMMEYQIRQILDTATAECPLLLETPCGEGTEVCASMEEMANFFLRFSETERRSLGLCIDTCHVFASGIDPLYYLSQWDTTIVPIKLVHFNDSKDYFASKKDHHMTPGLGYIGYERMMQILLYCKQYNIPMVRE